MPNQRTSPLLRKCNCVYNARFLGKSNGRMSYSEISGLLRLPLSSVSQGSEFPKSRRDSWLRLVRSMLAGIVPNRPPGELTQFGSGQMTRHEDFRRGPGRTAPTRAPLVRQSVKFVHYAPPGTLGRCHEANLPMVLTNGSLPIFGP